MRVCLAFHARNEFLDEPKCVERGIISTFQRAVARLQTLKPREMRTEKLTSVELTRGHSLLRKFRGVCHLRAPEMNTGTSQAFHKKSETDRFFFVRANYFFIFRDPKSWIFLKIIDFH